MERGVPFPMPPRTLSSRRPPSPRHDHMLGCMLECERETDATAERGEEKESKGRIIAGMTHRHLTQKKNNSTLEKRKKFPQSTCLHVPEHLTLIIHLQQHSEQTRTNLNRIAKTHTHDLPSKTTSRHMARQRYNKQAKTIKESVLVL